jgi:hypothetical protein
MTSHTCSVSTVAVTTVDLPHLRLSRTVYYAKCSLHGVLGLATDDPSDAARLGEFHLRTYAE